MAGSARLVPQRAFDSNDPYVYQQQANAERGSVATHFDNTTCTEAGSAGEL